MIRPVSKYLRGLFSRHWLLGPEKETQTLADADAVFQDLVNQGRVPGMSVCLLRAGQVVLKRGYGHADLRQRRPPHPERTLFRTASISKPISATALMMLVAEGTMELDASYYTYVPYFPKKEYDISIRQLAGHTAGIRGYRGKEYGLNLPLGIRDSLQIFQDDPLLFEPGTGYLYNSFDWVMLSLAMEEATGKPFGEIVWEKVLQPLGMQHTCPEMPGDTVQDIATFYSPDKGSGFRKAIPVNNAYKLAGGGYLSTAADIALLGQAYLDQSIGRQSLVAEFLSPQMVGNQPTYYGLGWEVSRDAGGRPYFGHTGSSVGAYTRFRVYPDSGVVYVCLVNCSDPGIVSSLDRVADLIHHAAT